MRYVTNADDCLVAVSFGADFECEWGYCSQYDGAIPAGYASLETWYAEESEKLSCWKVIDGELTRAAGAVAPKDKTIFDLIYPVGSIYLSVSPVSPADLFGGRWEQIQDTFLLGAGLNYEAGTTGGAAEHTLTVEELPSHRHMMHGVETDFQEGGWVAARSATFDQMTDDGTTYTDYTGEGLAHNNMPPYLAVYMWKRIEDKVPSGLHVEDDDDGNVIITSYGEAVIVDDGEGNVAIVDSGDTIIVDDGEGNVTILEEA